MPSAVSRLRSQVAQKGTVVEAIMPKIVPSGKEKRCAGAEESSRIGSIDPYRFVRIWRISACESTLLIDQSVAPPTSIYSMNRTSPLTALPYSIKDGVPVILETPGSRDVTDPQIELLKKLRP